MLHRTTRTHRVVTSGAALAVHFLAFAKLLVTYGVQYRSLYAAHKALAIIARRTLTSTPCACVPVLKPRPGLCGSAGLVLNERSLSDRPVPATTYLAWLPLSEGDMTYLLRVSISRVR
jgi:hypothetical protein